MKVSSNKTIRLGSTGQMNVVDIDEDLAKIMLKLEPNRIEGETLSEF